MTSSSNSTYSVKYDNIFDDLNKHDTVSNQDWEEFSDQNHLNLSNILDKSLSNMIFFSDEQKLIEDEIRNFSQNNASMKKNIKSLIKYKEGSLFMQELMDKYTSFPTLIFKNVRSVYIINILI